MKGRIYFVIIIFLRFFFLGGCVCSIVLRKETLIWFFNKGTSYSNYIIERTYESD